ncbi:NUDIX domain-containing protein [Sphingobium sp. AP49]|uniref:NUDIX domain-containing protein n=1 Tax=Sphingobium sp. AP49 TaxID=1144307 RepID=UPI00026EE4DA|nr:NUDIX domain-containing protein [Sphingobium sp. AP49]WHO40359.1 NUDIX domain-containing protein [Sphingobium sp. AP49]
MTILDDGSRAAATAVIVRDVADGPPELLMMERAATMAFAAGALVFPGGGVDARDLALAERVAGDLPRDEAAARIAAIRETIEESGLGIALSGQIEADALIAIRAGLLTGDALGDLLAEHGIDLALDELEPFARWHPSPREKAIRVYDTRFYLARAPDGQVAQVDATENVRLFWSSAAATLARCDAGEGHIIFPTRRNLERLAQFASHAELVAHARGIPVEKVRPWFEDRDGEPHLCIPGHLGYPVTSEPMRQVRRG